MLVSEVIDRTYLEWLVPSGIDRPAFDFLATPLTASGPASFNVTGRVPHIPPDSVIEIGSELILLADADVLTLTPAERGYYNTLATDHATGDMVRIDAKYPRATLFNMLKSVIAMLRPWGLYWRDVDIATTFSSREVRTLPAGGERILSVLVRDAGNLESYTKLTREGKDWILYREFDPSKFLMRRGGGEDAEMRVVYTKDFIEPTDEAVDLDTCGVPERDPAVPPARGRRHGAAGQGAPARTGRGDPPDAGHERGPGRHGAEHGAVDAPHVPAGLRDVRAPASVRGRPAHVYVGQDGVRREHAARP